MEKGGRAGVWGVAEGLSTGFKASRAVGNLCGQQHHHTTAPTSPGKDPGQTIPTRVVNGAQFFVCSKQMHSRQAILL